MGKKRVISERFFFGKKVNNLKDGLFKLREFYVLFVPSCMNQSVCTLFASSTQQ